MKQHRRVCPVSATARLAAGTGLHRGGGYLAEHGAVRKALLASLLAGVLHQGSAGAEEVALLAHRATYELRLEGHSRNSGIEGAHGLLAVEVTDACDAWAIRQGIALTMLREENQVTTLSEFDSQEAKDGSWYRFDDSTRVEPGGTERSSGQATAAPDAVGRVHVELPVVDEAPLPAGTLFPTAHLSALLARAMAGERLMSDILYDGTEGTVLYDVTTLVGTRAIDEASGLRVWPMRLAYFIRGSTSETPDIELSVRLREDGVVLAVSYDYGSFVLAGVLQSLEPLPAPDC